MDYDPNTTLTPEQMKMRQQEAIINAMMAGASNLTQPQQNGGRFATPTSPLNAIAQIALTGAGAYRKGQLGKQPGKMPGQTMYDQPIGPEEQPGYIDPFL